MKSLLLLSISLMLLSTGSVISQCCTVTIDMYDSWGDGWNGASLDIYIDGVLDGNYTLGAGSSGSQTIGVCDGEVFEVVFNSGSFDGEITYEISNSNGVIFSDGPSPSTGTVFTESNMCSVTPSCTNTDPYGSATAPTDSDPIEISTCQYQEEYNTISSVVAGETYVSDLDCGGFITVRSGSYNGTVVASGAAPLSWTASTSTTHYVHYNTNSSCGTATSCCTSTLECATCPAPVPPPQDCEGALMVCNDNTFNGDAVDNGDVFEINASNSECDMVDENQSTWFYVNIGTGGTLEMTIDPTNGTDDYDWAIWGPYTSSTAAANCPPIEPPIRCNTSANTPQTGMNTSASNNYEYPGWSTYEWSNPINASAGDVYIMMIDNWSASGSPFTLNWGGTAGLSCTSVVLPIELMDFNGENNGNQNLLYWSTQSEKNNDYFIIEYSPTGVDWTTVDVISGAGSTTIHQNYSTTHRDYEKGINYYRLSQVDFNGDIAKHKVISIDNSSDRKLLKRVNTLGQEVSADYKGIVILYFSDGSIVKVMQ